MTPKREKLKHAKLAENKANSFKVHKKRLYQCNLCGKFDTDGMDLHEVWITRNNVRGTKLADAVTEAACNTIIICRECNAGTGQETVVDGIIRICRAEAKWARNLLGQKLVLAYGANHIVEWIESLKMKQPDDYIRAVRAIEKQLFERKP